MVTGSRPDIEKLKLGKRYETGILASVDWVAGGNFDGYLYKKRLVFKAGSDEVVIETITNTSPSP